MLMEVRMDRLILVVSKMHWAARTGPQGLEQQQLLQEPKPYLKRC
jgi:hypothetical protein